MFNKTSSNLGQDSLSNDLTKDIDLSLFSLAMGK